MPILEHLINASERIAGARSTLNTPSTPILPCNINFTGPYAEENRALTILYNNFEVFDTAKQGDLSKADGIIDRGDLEVAALRDDEIGEAARYILDHPDLFKFLDTGTNNKDYMDKVEEGRFHATGGDGKISQKDIEEYIGKRTVNNILQDIHAQIDVAAKGGSPDGSLSRNDYEAFLRSGKATPEQEIAIQIVLQHGAVDGEQGWTNRLADWADTVGDVSGYVALGAAVVAAGAATVATAGAASPGLVAVATAVSGFSAGLATSAGGVSTGASATEMGLGIVTHDQEHIVGPAIDLATGMFGSRAEVIADGLGGGPWADVVIGGVEEYTSLGIDELIENNESQAPDVTLDCDLEN